MRAVTKVPIPSSSSRRPSPRRPAPHHPWLLRMEPKFFSAPDFSVWSPSPLGIPRATVPANVQVWRPRALHPGFCQVLRGCCHRGEGAVSLPFGRLETHRRGLSSVACWLLVSVAKGTRGSRVLGARLISRARSRRVQVPARFAGQGGISATQEESLQAPCGDHSPRVKR